MINHFAMPHPLEVPALVEAYSQSVKKGRPLLADDALRERLDEALSSGQGFVRLLAVDEKQAKPADLDIDGSWGGLRALVTATARLCTRRGPTALTPEQEERAQRAALLDERWIGGNLQFLKERYPSQWRESQLRLERLDEPMRQGSETPREALEGLGFTWALERLLETHATYGRVLGFADTDGPASDALNTWERALARFLSGVSYHHPNDQAVHASFIKPYEAALEEGRLRRRNVKDLRAARMSRSKDDTGEP